MCVGNRRRKPDGNQLPSFRGSPENTAEFACALQEKRSCGQKNGDLVCASTAQITSGGRGKMGRGKWGKMGGKMGQPELREFSTSPARTGSRCANPEAASVQSRKSLSSGWPVFPACFPVNSTIGLIVAQRDQAKIRSMRFPPHRLNCSCRRHPSWALHH